MEKDDQPDFNYIYPNEEIKELVEIGLKKTNIYI